MSWDASDNTVIDHYAYRNDTSSWTNTTDTSHLFTGFSDEPHTVYVKVWDVAGNVHVTHVTFTVDTINPDVWIIDPTDGEEINSDSVKVTWDASDSITAVTTTATDLTTGAGAGYTTTRPRRSRFLATERTRLR